MTRVRSTSGFIRSNTNLFSHVVGDITKLQPGDHLYVHMGPHRFYLMHHGIVYHVPTDNEFQNMDMDQKYSN